MAATNAASGALNLAAYLDDVVAEIDAAGDADPKNEATDTEVDADRVYVRAYIEGREAYMAEQLTWDSFR